MKARLSDLADIYLVGNEDCDVDVGCDRCDRGGLPLASYDRSYVHYVADDRVVKVSTVEALVVFALSHASADVHGPLTSD